MEMLPVLLALWFFLEVNLNKLEQQKHLHFEDTPAASWLPILLIHIESQVKTRQSQIAKT